MPVIRLFGVLPILIFCVMLPLKAAANPPTFGAHYRLGDRPSVCINRASAYLAPNLDTMTKIAIALQSEEALDEVGLVRSADGSSKLAMSLDRVEVKVTR